MAPVRAALLVAIVVSSASALIAIAAPVAAVVVAVVLPIATLLSAVLILPAAADCCTREAAPFPLPIRLGGGGVSTGDEGMPSSHSVTVHVTA